MEEKLIEAIIEQLGHSSLDDEAKETLKDVTRGGANAGFAGFTYSADCLEFYKKNKSRIIAHLENEAKDLGQELFEMIRGFNCMKGHEIRDAELAEILYQNNYEHEMSDIIIDAVCWCVLENLAFQYDC